MPLALTAERRLDERRQRALCRYYLAAGAGGLAVGVHTTQFAIREPRHGLLRSVLALVADELGRREMATGARPVRVAGVCGATAQAIAEATLARELGYHAGLLSVAALRQADDDALLAHCRAVAEVLPLFGFYLQPAVGGRVLSYHFWWRFAEIERVAAIKIAPFNRYRTLDVVRAVAEAGRDDIALYTGNDDQIVLDLLTPFRFRVGGRTIERRIVGGLLGQWAVWTQRAVQLLEECHALAGQGSAVPAELLRRANEITDANAAVFDAANDFAGCVPGIHAVLRRQGLLAGTWCLDSHETLGPGQAEEIERVYRAYPHLADDDFVAQHRDEWLRDT
jgi:dihydrodipicolinate synthase/N-acetylneuraminate lyase